MYNYPFFIKKKNKKHYKTVANIKEKNIFIKRYYSNYNAQGRQQEVAVTFVAFEAIASI